MTFFLRLTTIYLSILEVSKPAEQVAQAVDDIAVLQEDYQALSSKEESDLDQMMSECQAAISNAEAFAENLSKQLSVLDGVIYLLKCKYL